MVKSSASPWPAQSSTGAVLPRGALRMSAPLTLSSRLWVCDAWPTNGPQSRPWTLIAMLMLDVAASKIAVPRPVALLVNAGTCWAPSRAIRKAAEPCSAILATATAKV